MLPRGAAEDRGCGGRRCQLWGEPSSWKDPPSAALRLSRSEARSGEGRRRPSSTRRSGPSPPEAPGLPAPHEGVTTPPACPEAQATGARASAPTRRSGTSAASASPRLPAGSSRSSGHRSVAAALEGPAPSWCRNPQATDGHSPSGTGLPRTRLQLQQLGEGISQGLQVPHHRRGPPSPLSLALLLRQLYGFDFWGRRMVVSERSREQGTSTQATGFLSVRAGSLTANANTKPHVPGSF